MSDEKTTDVKKWGPAAMEYLKQAERLQFVTKENRHRFLAVAEMMEHPLTVSQVRAQIMRHQIESRWVRKNGDKPMPLKMKVKLERRIGKVMEQGFAEYPR